MRIGASALVIAKPFLQRAHPGGLQGFLGDQLAEQTHTQRVEFDDHLVAIIDLNHERLVATYHRISALACEDARKGALCVLIDPFDSYGLPMSPCDWLRCTKVASGIVELEYRGTADGRANGDAILWSDEAAAASAPSLIELAVEDGLITWLDLDTGRQIKSALPSATAMRNPSNDDPVPMLNAVTTVLNERDWECRSDNAGTIWLTINSGTVPELSLEFTRTKARDAAVLLARLPRRAAPDRIVAIMSFVADVNQDLSIGGFAVDRRDGEITYRVAIIAPEGRLRPSAIAIALDSALEAVDRYGNGFLAVAQGDDPEDDAWRFG